MKNKTPGSKKDWVMEGFSKKNEFLCENPAFVKATMETSPYPDNFIPNGAKLFIGVDEGSPDGDCTVSGFYKDGEYHIQRVDHRNK